MEREAKYYEDGFTCILEFIRQLGAPRSNPDIRPWRSQPKSDAEDRLHETAPNSETYLMNEQDSHTFWSVSESGILKAPQTAVAGLTDHEARARYAISSTLALKKDRRSSFAILASQFNNPIIWLLFFSAVLSYFLDDATNCAIIIVILVLSGLLSFWQKRVTCITFRGCRNGGVDT